MAGTGLSCRRRAGLRGRADQPRSRVGGGDARSDVGAGPSTSASRRGEPTNSSRRSGADPGDGGCPMTPRPRAVIEPWPDQPGPEVGPEQIGGVVDRILALYERVARARGMQLRRACWPSTPTSPTTRRATSTRWRRGCRWAGRPLRRAGGADPGRAGGRADRCGRDGAGNGGVPARRRSRRLVGRPSSGVSRDESTTIGPSFFTPLRRTGSAGDVVGALRHGPVVAAIRSSDPTEATSQPRAASHCPTSSRGSRYHSASMSGTATPVAATASRRA